MIGIEEGLGGDSSKSSEYRLNGVDMIITVNEHGEGDVQVDIEAPRLKTDHFAEDAVLHGVLLILSTLLTEDMRGCLLEDLDSLDESVQSALERIPALVSQIQEKGFWKDNV